LQEAAVDVNPGRQIGLNFRRAAWFNECAPSLGIAAFELSANYLENR
jgi:hypothetical protein